MTGSARGAEESERASRRDIARGRPDIRARVALAGLSALSALSSASAAIAAPPSTPRVVVLAPSESDVRVAPALEAIGYWNRTFAELGLRPAFGATEVVVASPATRQLENYAWQISRRAGRPAAGSFEPEPPAALAELDAGVVVLLSSQTLMPFAWPTRGDRYFVAARVETAEHAGESLRVIAHELGHVLGLRHDRANAASLMCMPCGPEPDAAPLELPALSERERKRLLELHGRPQKPAS